MLEIAAAGKNYVLEPTTQPADFESSASSTLFDLRLETYLTIDADLGAETDAPILAITVAEADLETDTEGEGGPTAGTEGGGEATPEREGGATRETGGEE